MILKEFLAKIVAYFFVKRIKKWSMNPVATQEKVFKQLIASAKKTSFGIDHSFNEIKNQNDFIKRVPIRSYEDLKLYIERVRSGETNVLWPGKPIYFAKTSGTTSGAKYIPITKASAPFHLNSSRDAMFYYINETGKTEFLRKKIIFLQGSPELEEKNGIKIGRLSGITAHMTPKYLKGNVMPSWKTNCIEDWEKKVCAIAKETTKEDMSIIGGIPPWVQEERFSEKRNFSWDEFKLRDIDVNFSPDMSMAILTFYANGAYTFNDSKEKVDYSTRASAVWIATNTGWKMVHANWAPFGGSGIPK